MKIVKRIIFLVFYLLVVLVFCDLILILFNIFPPKHLYGDQTVGFLTPQGTGVPYTYQSLHWRFADSDSGLISVNERGFRSDRTIGQILSSPKKNAICVIGDSHTDLPYKKEYTHPFVLERCLRESGFPDVEVFAAGRGGYSPLQACLYFNHFVQDLRPSVLILNLYTGNDFFDMMRIDDRPYYEANSASNYRIHPPVWYKFTDPSTEGSLIDKSRVLFLIEMLARRSGLWRILVHLQYLIDLSRLQGEGMDVAFSYMSDLRRTEEPSLAFPPAFAAQILNQHLFFRYFPATRAESLHRLEFLLSSMRKQHPRLTLILSPIPSAALSGELQTDPAFHAVLSRTNVDYASLLSEERDLYDSCRTMATRQNWQFINNLDLLHSESGRNQLFLSEDLHLSPFGSSVIGRNEAIYLGPIICP